MWECPDLFALDGRHVLAYSPMGLPSRAPLVLVGRLDYASGRFAGESRHVADHGFDFYAPQSFEDEAGRRIVIGWMENWESRTWPSKAHGWAGAMAVPRVLRLRADGTPLWSPVPQVESLRCDATTVAPRAFGPGEQALDGVRGDSLDLEAEIDPGEARSVALVVRRSADGAQRTRVVLDRTQGTLAIDREKAGAGDGGVHTAPLRLGPGETLRFRVLVDRSSVEVFAQDGSVVLTDRVFPDSSSVGTALEADGRARLASLRAWRLAPAYPPGPFSCTSR
jgi:beta-fructofuranosidase